MGSGPKKASGYDPLQLTVLDPTVLFWAVALGVVMPLASAVFYPTYHVMMPQPWYETTRLLEFPYVALEVGFILWAGRKGFDLGQAVKILPSDIKAAAALLITVMILGAIFVSRNVGYTLTHSILWLIHIIFVLAVCGMLTRALRNRDNADGFMAWHAIGLAVLATYTGWWFLTPPAPESLPFGEIMWRGAIPGFIDVRHMGSWTGAIAAGFAVRILYGSQDSRLKWARLFYFLAAGMTVWSGTRAAILAMIVVTLVFVICLRRLPAWKRIGWAVLLTICACGGAYLLLWDTQTFWLITSDELVSSDEFVSTRTILWGRTFELWLQSPWLGLGTGAIFWEYGPEMTPTQPHNVILQFLISWGAVGAAAGLWIVLRAIWAVHRNGMARPEMFVVLAFFYALLFQSLLEGMLHYPRFIVSIIVLGVIVYSSGVHSGDRQSRSRPDTE